jgi:hypothetical protein
VISYEIKPDAAQIADAVSLFEFVGGNSKDAIRVAINRAAPKVRTKASQAIRTQVRLQASYVNSRLTIRRASRTNLSGAVATPSRGLLLSKFSTDPQVSGDKISWLKPPDEPAKGIRVKVKPSGPTKGVGGEPKPFYMVLPKSRALAIVRRRTAVGAEGGEIEVLYGPSLSQVFNTVRDDVLPEAGQIYQAELLDAMRYLLTKQYPKE